MALTLDERDHRILSLLEADAWLSYSELARRVNLSASAVQRRVERMTSAGVIRGAKAEVALAERSLTLFVLVELADESREALQDFSAALAANPAVAEAHYVAGQADILLKLRLPDMAAYDRFLETHVNASPAVRRFTTLTSLRPLGTPA